MHLDDKYKEKLISCIGDKATKWFEELPEIVKQCKLKWGLYDLRPFDDLSYNYVCSAKSNIYGDVVLKMGFPHKEIYTEMDALKDFTEDSVCKIYDSSKELNAMLLELILPGKTLWSVKDHNEKVVIAAPIINKVSTKVSDTTKYPYHYDWIEKSFKFLREHYDINHPMYEHMDMVENIYSDLDFEGNDKLLLHGDLHHSNILSSESGWRVIDPKGVIGFKSLEVGRFMNNHYCLVDKDLKVSHLDFMLTEFSKVFGFSKDTILKSFYIDHVLSLSWRLDEVEKDMVSINRRIAECNDLLTHIKDRTFSS